MSFRSKVMTKKAGAVMEILDFSMDYLKHEHGTTKKKVQLKKWQEVIRGIGA